ncbi:MAG: sirohydrochlorin cobaltochelatase [Desulfobacterales bacterium RIFOXYA12_FULL_46_15]|nr:MAG: sirohydrochlorin cobaltochelatase [Desulfobacula sp. GWF2_41_7]OGR28548.1 MAG: sirohydrochlorin cobaltochelatase [Desulfobacterales bacterium RIFOXYA12_FULL_46_15]
MKKLILFFLFTCLILPSLVFASGHGHKREMKKGILLVAFGSSIPEASVSFENINKRVKEEFPETPVFWAYTSSMIRSKLAKEGKILDSEAMALAKMTDQGFTRVAAQSLHTIRGEEFDDLVRTLAAFEGLPGGIEKIVIGAPLLSSQKDMEDVTRAILANLPAGRKQSEAVVLMGHGTPHPSNVFYTALMYHLQKKDPLVFMGTVEGSPTIDDLIPMIKEKKSKKIWLMPFMSVAGDHARNDLAGDEPGSWKSMLEKQGFKTEAVLKGTAQYDNMLDIWMDHLKQAMTDHP